MSAEPSPRPWRVNGHSIEANDPDGLWLQNEKTGLGVVANLPSCPKSRMSKKNRSTWDAIVEANARLIVDAVNERDRLRSELESLQTSYNELHSTLADKSRNYEDVIAYHERSEENLREIITVLIPIAEMTLTYQDAMKKAGSDQIDGIEAARDEIRKILAAARAAVGENEK